MQETGINLIEKAFEWVADQQIRAYKLKTGKHRSQIASKIREMSRLQLLVEALQRVQRMLSEPDQAEYSEALAPFIQGHAGQYVHYIKGEDTAEHVQRIGVLMQRLLLELRPGYAQEPVYQMLKRVLGEHFRVEEHGLKTKLAKELSANSLQPPDDMEATYREKGQKSYKGYVANLTETCDPHNPLQLITNVQVAPNRTEDTELLVESLPNLKARMEIDTLYMGGGYESPDVDQTLQDHQVEQIQTAIRGRAPTVMKLHLENFEIKQASGGTPTQITCPGRQTVAVHANSRNKGFVAHFAVSTCQACPFCMNEACPAQAGKRDLRFHLRFTQAQASVSQRRRRSLKHQKEGRNLRATSG